MTASPNAAAESLPTLLKNYFLRTTRSQHGLNQRIISRGLFDFGKILDIYAEHGVDPAWTRHIALEDAAQDISPSDPTRRVLLKPPDKVDHYVFLQNEYLVPGVRVFRLKNIYISYDVTNFGRAQYYIFSEDKALVNGLFFGGDPFLEDPIATIEGTSVFADDFFARFNICHLLFDKLPRAYGAWRDWGATNAIFMSGTPYVQDLFDLFGITAVIPGPKQRRGTLFVRDCIVFSDSFNQLHHPARMGSPLHLEALQALRARIKSSLPVPDDVPDRFFITRAPDLPRAIENADAVNMILARHGFVGGDPATMSPREQMAFFQKVSVLAGAHGAGLSNLTFMDPGSTVIELLPPLCATGAYWSMSDRLGLSYRHLLCDDPELGPVNALGIKHNGANNRHNIVVPEAALDDLLGSLDSRRG